MSKLDELLKEWDAGVKQYGSRNLATVGADMAAELRRLQARDRRLEELEARWRRCANSYASSTTNVGKGSGNPYHAGLGHARQRCADELRAIREET